MICTCKSCKLPYWKYRRDWPPNQGFCSYICSLPGSTDAIAVPQLPHEVLAKLKLHLNLAHDTDSIFIWTDCETCEELQQEYAASLSYHLQEAQAAMYNHAGATM